MVPPLAFSRLQLAAALIEYDNDLDDDDGPRRSAQNSAIFAHLFRDSIALQRRSNHLEESLSSAEIRAVGDQRRSVASFKNPFSVDNQSDNWANEEEDEELEVDLESWGLDAFMSRDKAKPPKPNTKESTVNSTRLRVSSVGREASTIIPRRAMVTSKSMSLGGLPDFKNAASIKRSRSLSLPLELTPIQSYVGSTSHADGNLTMGTQHITSPMESLIIDQSRYPGKSPTANTDPDSIRLNILEKRGENPFAIDRPSRISRFDPKIAEWQGSLPDVPTGVKQDGNLPSMNEGSYGKHRRYSTVELLRPKVLVMPSPLQTTLPEDFEAEPVRKVGEGFALSTDGPPLPPGAKSSQRLSSLSALEPISPSEPFVSNPLHDLSLSQQTFRSTLGIHGKISDFDPDLPRATHDGQTVQLNPPLESEGLSTNINEIPSFRAKPAGKLFGKSLIDDLEARKANLRSKQRVFRGDQRPAMMARNLRPTTLIDSASLTNQSIPQPKNARASRNIPQNPSSSSSLKPPPDFKSYGKSTDILPAVTDVNECRSVFGVDTLWQHEMERLGEIQLQEAREQEEACKEVEPQKEKSERRRRKAIAKVQEPLEQSENVDITFPKLSYIPPSTTRPPLPEDPDNLSADEGPDTLTFNDHGNYSWHVDSSDDEGHQPQRNLSRGIRYPRVAEKTQTLPARGYDSEEDVPLATIHKAGIPGSDDEDKPLAQVLRQVNIPVPPKQRAKRISDPRCESGSDEDQPLALRASRIPRPRQNDEDEDNMPLALHPQQQRRTQYQMVNPLQGQMVMQSQMQNNLFMSAHASMLEGLYGLPLVNPLAMGPMPYQMPIPSPPPAIDEVNFGRVDRWRRDVAVDGSKRR